MKKRFSAATQALRLANDMERQDPKRALKTALLNVKNAYKTNYLLFNAVSSHNITMQY